MALQIRWIDDIDDPKVKKLLCHKCMNGTFLISHAQMARQVKALKAHHMRLVARCTECGDERRIGFKG